jgi:glycogen synthase
VVLQNFWLSAPYGRNWSYLWTGQIPTWQTVLLIAAFFIGVWGLLLLVFGILSKKHSWVLPVFAIGLGAPRWCQMLWGTTFIGYSLPWADIGSGIDRIRTGLLVGKSLWLWLGVLDAIQGVGFGMMLLQVYDFELPLLSADPHAYAYCIHTHQCSSPRGNRYDIGSCSCTGQSRSGRRISRLFVLSYW